MIYKNGDNTQSAVVEIVVNTVEEVEELETKYSPGSTCIVLENSSVYMLGADKTWHEL